jgi:hypothetical protein
MPYNPSWSEKDIRQYHHIEASTGSKRIAAGAVNNLAKRHAKGRKGKSRRRRKGV